MCSSKRQAFNLWWVQISQIYVDRWLPNETFLTKTELHFSRIINDLVNLAQHTILCQLLSYAKVHNFVLRAVALDEVT